jgi:hypothetical protein
MQHINLKSYTGSKFLRLLVSFHGSLILFRCDFFSKPNIWAVVKWKLCYNHPLLLGIFADDDDHIGGSFSPLLGRIGRSVVTANGLFDDRMLRAAEGERCSEPGALLRSRTRSDLWAQVPAGRRVTHLGHMWNNHGSRLRISLVNGTLHSWSGVLNVGYAERAQKSNICYLSQQLIYVKLVFHLVIL